MEQLHTSLSVPVLALGWAILHSLWQGLIVYVLLRVTFGLAPRASARFKYNMALAGMSAIFLWFADTFYRYWDSLRAITIIVSRPVNGVPHSNVVHTTLATGGGYVSYLHTLMPWLQSMLPVLVLFYLVGVLFFASRFGYHMMYLRSLRTTGISEPSPAVLDKLYDWKERLGIAQHVRLLFSEKVDIPMMMGVLKPLILIPLASFARLSPDQFEAILVHELAHIKRRDYLVNIIQTCVETLLFFNPFVWLLSSVLRSEREHCCDDVVLVHTARPLSYAGALTTLEAFRLNPLAMAATGNKNQLLNRIKRMMEMKKQTPASAFIPALLVALGLTVSLLWLSPVFAQSKKDKQKTTEQKAQTSAKAEIVIVDDNGQKRTYQSINDVPPAEREKVREMLGGVPDIPQPPMPPAAPGAPVPPAPPVIDEEEIAEAMEEAGRAMKAIDRKKLNEEIKQAMEESKRAMDEVDWEEINREVKQAMAESKKAMKEIDWEEINREVKQAMKESSQAMKEAKMAMKDVDWDEINEGMNAAMEASGLALSQAGMALAAINWDSIGHAVSAAMKVPGSPQTYVFYDSAGKAVSVRTDSVRTINGKNIHVYNKSNTKGTSSAYAYSGNGGKTINTGSYEKMLAKMEQEGLINRSDDYSVQKKNGKLYINGKRQPDEVYNKFKKYLDDAKTLSLSGSKNSLNVSVSN